jgi:RimJ/RimL family protein N-acetyltransferase
MSSDLFDVEYRDAQVLLRAFEPTADEVRAVAAQLSGYYNDEHNRAMLTHEDDMSAEEVIVHYAESRKRGDRLFLLELDGLLVGDADFRHFDAESAEYAIMIGARNLQGRGLGRKFTTMLHAWAFRGLGLRRVYVTILPANRASVRLFEQLGYGPDHSPRARSLIDEESDVTLSMERSAFEKQHGTMMDGVQFAPRTPMDLPAELQWLDGVAVSVVACDPAGLCTYMNERACQTFAKDGGRALVGRSLLDCHPEPARSRLLDMLRAPRANSYTVEKSGKKKLIHQTPFFRDGVFAGVVEIAIELPASLPHFVRE